MQCTDENGCYMLFLLLGPDVAHSKPYIHTFTELCWILWYRPSPFPPTVFFRKFAKCCKPTFFELLPGDFIDFHEILYTASVDSPDKKVIEIILVFQTIVKLLNDNFLSMLLKTQSVAYLHIGLSQWHETQVTTSPWATKAPSTCRQNLPKAFTYVTPGGVVHFDASP